MIWSKYLIILLLLIIAELAYFRIADHFNIIDKPNERSSHFSIVLRGGGIIFAISILVWMGWQMVQGSWCTVSDYLPFVVGLILIAGVSFWDDVHSLPDCVRLVAQFVAMVLMFWSINLGSGFMVQGSWFWQVLIGIAAMIVCVGATNIYNFMDGINGITAGYSLAVLAPLMMVNDSLLMTNGSIAQGFVEPSLLAVTLIGVLVFSWFNFRPKGKAKCFAGDVGSIGIAFILLFMIGRLIVKTGDITWLIFMVVYAVDGCCTIMHRIMLHENLGQAHRKHAFQIMANELQMGHVKVSLIYMALQLVISLGFIYLCPNTILAHWIFLMTTIVVMSLLYVLFMKKYYHLHEEYLREVRGGVKN